ncbi:MAG: endospore germination permease [Clostridia bacterium]|nr:endospore germination permease [Clostridia bacterium]
MNSDIVNPKQATAILSVFLISGTSVTMNNYLSKQNTWISLIISVAVSAVMFLLFAKILKLFKGKNLFEISERCFGRLGSKLISAVVVIYAFIRGIVALRSFCEMVTITSLDETPILFIAVFVMLTSAFMIKSGLYVMGKCSLFFAAVIVFITALTTLLSIGVMQFENLMLTGISAASLVADSVSFITHPFLDALLLLCLFSHIKNNANHSKIFIWALILAALVMVVTLLRDILILGGETFSQLYFPSYSATGIINIYNFLQRISVLDAVKTLFSVLIEVSVCLFCVTKGLGFLIRYDSYKNLAFPVAMLMSVLCTVCFSSTMVLADFTKNLTYFALPAQILLSLVILGMGTLKNKQKNS